MYDKWWRSNSKQEACTPPRDKAKTKANALNVDNIGGIFVVLLCGIAFSVLVAIVEFYYNSRHIEADDVFDPFFYFNKSPSSPGRQSLCSEMTQELCYALQCYGPRQRPTLKRQCLKCAQTAFLLADSTTTGDGAGARASGSSSSGGVFGYPADDFNLDPSHDNAVSEQLVLKRSFLGNKDLICLFPGRHSKTPAGSLIKGSRQEAVIGIDCGQRQQAIK